MRGHRGLRPVLAVTAAAAVLVAAPALAIDRPFGTSRLYSPVYDALSPHRTGGMPEAFREIGRLAVADLELVLRGLPPQLCKRAEPETVGRMRSKPVARS